MHIDAATLWYLAVTFIVSICIPYAVFLNRRLDRMSEAFVMMDKRLEGLIAELRVRQEQRAEEKAEMVMVIRDLRQVVEKLAEKVNR